jgi:hypothetical protein
MRSLLTTTAERAIRYLDTIQARRVAPAPDAVGRLAALGGTFPDAPAPPDAIVAMLDDVGSPATVVNAGGR